MIKRIKNILTLRNILHYIMGYLICMAILASSLWTYRTITDAYYKNVKAETLWTYDYIRAYGTGSKNPGQVYVGDPLWMETSRESYMNNTPNIIYYEKLNCDDNYIATVTDTLPFATGSRVGKKYPFGGVDFRVPEGGEVCFVTSSQLLYHHGFKKTQVFVSEPFSILKK